MTSSKKTLGIGFVGTGAVAGAHADAFAKVPGCEIVAACSRKKSRAREFLDAHGRTEAEAYSKLDDFLAHDGLDVVAICTPHPNHPEETIRAARAGKHVVIEKPVALDREALKRMVREVNKAGVQTSVCFELRWIGLFENVKALVGKGLLGELFYGETSYFHGIGPWVGQYHWNIKKKMAGDALLTAGCHALDGLIWLMGSRVKEVAAMSNTSAKNPLSYGYDPNLVAILRFENGAIGKVGTSIECRQPYHFPLVLMGTKGTVKDDCFSSLDFPGLDGWAKMPTSVPDSGAVGDHPYVGQFTAFTEGIRRGKAVHNDLANTAHVHEVMFAIQQAIRARKTVRVPKTPGT